MNNVATIRTAVYRTIDVVNELLPPEQSLECSDQLVLLGKTAQLDSMGFVNFIVALEEELESQLGRELNIVDLLNVHTSERPVSTVADLIAVLSERLV